MNEPSNTKNLAPVAQPRLFRSEPARSARNHVRGLGRACAFELLTLQLDVQTGRPWKSPISETWTLSPTVAVAMRLSFSR
jgi:hypothetical protein